MKLGKLDNDTLDRLILSRFKKTRPESFGAPHIGMDCATLDFCGDLIVTSCDPITSADARHICPCMSTATTLLPEARNPLRFL